MSPRKLSDSDKQEIAQLYCQPGETTSTLAVKFGVSSSTVSRVLKQILSDVDYAKLMQWKRSGERGTLELSSDLSIYTTDSAEVTDSSRVDSTPEAKADDKKTTSQAAKVTSESNQRRSRRRSNAPQSTESESSEEAPLHDTRGSISFDDSDHKVDTNDTSPKEAQTSDSMNEDTAESDVAAWVSEGLEAEDDYEADEEDDEDWDDEDWDDESDDDDDDDENVVPLPPCQGELAILSFDDFVVKKPCYLVVDRLAELITCPLKEFAELGLIPAEEEQARTLPIFDNHRVARRFARRNQRIIKIPNGLMLSKTQQYLQAKGITRLLFDG
jgi:transposase-like protein